MERLSKAVSDFNYVFFRELVRLDNLENNICSSISLIYYAMVALHIGAKNKSASQLKDLLGLEYSSVLETSQSEIQTRLKQEIEKIKEVSKLCYIILHRSNIVETYMNKMIEIFETEFEQIDFSDLEAVCARVNQWVSNNTEGMIPSILDTSSVTAETNLIIVNTIYFKSSWLSIFDKINTKEDKFYVKPETSVQVKMMFIEEDASFYTDDIQKAQILLKKFKNQSQIGIFALPDLNSNIGELITSLSTDVIKNWINLSCTEKVKCYIPKFTISQKFSSKTILEEMNLTYIFSDECDISGIIREPSYVSDVIHSARVEVDEEGATAAAATCILITRCCYIPPELIKTFRLDRPFIFIIYDKDLDYPLFMNAIIDPTMPN